MQSINCRDRTTEYFSTLEGFRKQQLTLSSQLFSHSNGINKPSLSSPSSSSSYSDPQTNNNNNNNSNNNNNGNNNKVARQSQFTESASRISKNISFVTDKLEKLTHLAKQRSLFEDQTQEINKLTSVIKGDLGDLDSDLKYLEGFSSNTKGAGRQNEQNSSAIVKDLKTKFANTSKSFMDVLHIRAKALKDQNSRRKHFETSSSSSFRTRKANPLESLLKNDYVGKKNNNIEDNDGYSQDDTQETEALLQDQEQQVAVEEDQYLASRHAAVQQIETTIVEISQMYARLMVILARQEDELILISDDTNNSLAHVDDGHKQLLKYFESISSEKMLILKVFAVLIIFLVFFVVFIA